jgi:hypothetical protein
MTSWSTAEQHGTASSHRRCCDVLRIMHSHLHRAIAKDFITELLTCQ